MTKFQSTGARNPSALFIKYALDKHRWLRGAELGWQRPSAARPRTVRPRIVRPPKGAAVILDQIETMDEATDESGEHFGDADEATGAGEDDGNIDEEATVGWSFALLEEREEHDGIDSGQQLEDAPSVAPHPPSLPPPRHLQDKTSSVKHKIVEQEVMSGQPRGQKRFMVPSAKSAPIPELPLAPSPKPAPRPPASEPPSVDNRWDIEEYAHQHGLNGDAVSCLASLAPEVLAAVMAEFRSEGAVDLLLDHQICHTEALQDER